MPQISIIIPVFNRAHCMERALASLHLQELRDWELIIGDDASTDATWDIVQRTIPAARLSRLEVNSGAASARNAAIKMATGEFLAFLDSDDEWLPGKLSAQIDFLESHPDFALCATSHIFQRRDGIRREVVVHNPPDWKAQLHRGQIFHGASTPLLRRSVVEKVGLQDESLRVLEDWDWMLRISQKHKIHVLPDLLTLIHENGPSDPDFTRLSTERFLSKHAMDFLSLGETHKRNMESQHWENAARCFFRQSRNREGMECLAKSFRKNPTRNPALLAAFPLAWWDDLFGTRILRSVLAKRSGLSIV